MKIGRFLLIPESPADVDSLRMKAQPLDEATLPDWLEPADEAHYRHVGDIEAADLSADHRRLLADEIQQAESAGLVIDQVTTALGTCRIYVTTNADYENWSIGVYTGLSPFRLGPAPGVRQPALCREDIDDTAASLIADPFMVQTDEQWWMFFELLNWRENKGEIGLAESADGLHWTYQQRVLVEPFHLSYPHVFEWDRSFYMVPETRQARDVRLYRASDFPWTWECVAVLMSDCELVDASLFRAGERWCILAADRASNRDDCLRLFTAESLFGPWCEHPSSPIVDGNPELARPAGRILLDGKRVFRFAQDGTLAYGREVHAVEITHLSLNDYQERVVRQRPVIAAAKAGWNSGGMHHLDVQRMPDGNWLACVDGWTHHTASTETALSESTDRPS